MTKRGHFPPGQLNNPTMPAAQKLGLTGTPNPGTSPVTYQSLPRHGAVAFLLPHLEQSNLAQQLDLSVPWFHPNNTQKGGPISQPLSIAKCPSSPYADSFNTGYWQNADANNNSTYDNQGFAMTGYSSSGRPDVGTGYINPAWPAGAVKGPGASSTDYAPLLTLFQYTMVVYFPGWTAANDSVLASNVVYTPEQITDGLSTSVMFVEVAGRGGAKCKMRVCDPSSQWFYGGWAHDMNGVRPKGFNYDGNAATPAYTGPCVMNCSNEYSIYSFHTGGSNMLFADGSVRFLRETITWAEFAPFGTRNRGDIATGDY